MSNKRFPYGMIPFKGEGNPIFPKMKIAWLLNILRPSNFIFTPTPPPPIFFRVDDIQLSNSYQVGHIFGQKFHQSQIFLFFWHLVTCPLYCFSKIHFENVEFFVVNLRPFVLGIGFTFTQNIYKTLQFSKEIDMVV